MAEQDAVTTESRSSVSVDQNSKGEPAVKVKIYEGFDEELVDAAQAKAISVYKATVTAVGA